MAKKLTKTERKEACLRKGKQWLLTYTGSPKKMNKHYREHFHVDAVTAAKDLQELGVNYTQEQLDQIKQAEEQRLRQRRMEREAKERELLDEYDRNDGICIVRNHNGITAENLSYILKRNDIKKSDACQSGFFEGTTPAYEAYMCLKKSLVASIN